MTQERDLLRTIAREPDDAARLVYSDWLEENGRAERAEFIRGQVRLDEIHRSKPPPDPEVLNPIFWGCPGTWRCPADTPERRELAFRSRQLLDTHVGDWLAPLGGLLKREWAWSRGFVEVADADPASLAASGAEAFDTNPIRRLILGGLGGRVDALGLIPADNRLTALDLILGGLTLGSLRELARFRHLGGLAELNLMLNRLTDDAIGFLCADPFFQRLGTIRLAFNQFTDEGRQRLRDHFGTRVSFDRERHPERLYAFRGDSGQASSQLVMGMDLGTWAGWCPDLTQVMIEEHQGSFTAVVFDHGGDLLRIEARMGERGRPGAWMNELGYRPATIRVKRVPSVHDFPKGWAEFFDSPDGLPGEYEDGRRVIEDWLEDDGFRHGSYCGGLYFNRKTGEPIASPRP